jgi:hypothetical protein
MYDAMYKAAVMGRMARNQVYVKPEQETLL